MGIAIQGNWLFKLEQLFSVSNAGLFVSADFLLRKPRTGLHLPINFTAQATCGMLVYQKYRKLSQLPAEKITVRQIGLTEPLSPFSAAFLKLA